MLFYDSGSDRQPLKSIRIRTVRFFLVVRIRRFGFRNLNLGLSDPFRVSQGPFRASQGPNRLSQLIRVGWFGCFGDSDPPVRILMLGSDLPETERRSVEL